MISNNENSSAKVDIAANEDKQVNGASTLLDQSAYVDNSYNFKVVDAFFFLADDLPCWTLKLI